MTRYPQIAPEDMYFEQIRAVRAVTERRKPSISTPGGVEGPFLPLVYVPGILDRLQSLGEHCRFHTAIPPKLRELAIIIAARHVAAPLEFHVHAMEAREFELAEEVIEAVAAQRRPDTMDEDEAIVYDFSTAIFAQGRISDELFSRADKRFGKAVIIDLLATCGYYATLGLGMNVTKPPTPPLVAGYVPAFSVPLD